MTQLIAGCTHMLSDLIVIAVRLIKLHHMFNGLHHVLCDSAD